jgi:hypothetical protein
MWKFLSKSPFYSTGKPNQSCRDRQVWITEELNLIYGKWNHFVFEKDIVESGMDGYIDGMRIARNVQTNEQIEEVRWIVVIF